MSAIYQRDLSNVVACASTDSLHRLGTGVDGCGRGKRLADYPRPLDIQLRIHFMESLGDDDDLLWFLYVTSCFIFVSNT